MYEDNDHNAFLEAYKSDFTDSEEDNKEFDRRSDEADEKFLWSGAKCGGAQPLPEPSPHHHHTTTTLPSPAGGGEGGSQFSSLLKIWNIVAFP